MTSIEITDDHNIIQFRGRGIVSSEPDATNIVTVDNPAALEQSGETVVFEIPDNKLVVEVPENGREIVTVGTQGTFGQSEDDVLNDNKHLDFNEDETQWYEGWSVPGSDDAEPAWKIKSTWIVNAQGDTDSMWADGSASRNKIWNDRATYTY